MLLTEEIVLARAREIGGELEEGIARILRFCCRFPACFPTIGSGKSKIELSGLTEVESPVLDRYLAIYIARYRRERQGTVELATVGTVADPIVDEVIVHFGNVPRDEVAQVSEYHRLSMAAENLVGALLERYIAKYIEPCGWTWCAGNTVRAIDFIKNDFSQVLQIKNRSNSENSSSSNIRTYMAQKGVAIGKWYRVDANTGKTKWESFPQAVAEGELTEEGFKDFVAHTAPKTHLTLTLPKDEDIETGMS
jgi:hypothetical protein